MSLDRSLKTAGSLIQHRSVLTRAERISKMTENGLFTDDSSPLGLPKVKSVKVAAKKKKAAKSEETKDDAKK